MKSKYTITIAPNYDIDKQKDLVDCTKKEVINFLAIDDHEDLEKLVLYLLKVIRNAK
jgi:hypothetical protein